MNKLILKTATGIAAVGLMVATVAPSAFAQTVKVKGNGYGSNNRVTVNSTSKCKVNQSNNTFALTLVGSKANTGGNKVKWNTGGSNSVTTGAATSTVSTTVTGGSNTANDPCCGCQEAGSDAVVKVSGNGATSTNTVTVTETDSKKVEQSSNTVAVTGVLSEANSGDNAVNGNTGKNATNDVTTDTATSEVTTSVTGGNNSL